jgi:hypothetical protein
VCVECNDDQTAGLCEELHADYGLDTAGANVYELLGEREPPGDVRRTDLLVTTAFHAGEVRELAERWGKPWIAVALRGDLFADVARMLTTGPVYFVVTDPRYAVKLRQIYAENLGFPRLRVRVCGQDDVADIPDGAPTYVSPTARRALGDSPLVARRAPEPRAVAGESARELLAFLARANAAALDGER